MAYNEAGNESGGKMGINQGSVPGLNHLFALIE